MGCMGFDCITNIFRDLFRPFRERKRKKMESHKAINNSLTTMVSEIDLSEHDDKFVKQHRKKKVYDSESNNVSYLFDKKNKRKEKSKTSLKMYNSSEEETSAQENVYESTKSDKQSVYEDTESEMSEIEKVSRKRSKTKIENKKSKKDMRDADKKSSRSANKIKLKAVSRDRNRSKENRDLDSDVRDYKGSKAHKKKAPKYAESSTTCYSSVSQNEESTNSDSRDFSSTQNDDMSKERISDNIMSSESIEYKKKNKKRNTKIQRSDSVSDDILHGYEHDNKSSDYFDVLKNKANESEYVNVLENYDKQNLEDIYDINQQIYDKLTEYLSRNLKP